MSDWLVAPGAAPLSATRVGGKAAGLARLHALGAPVPPWRVIPEAAAKERAWRGNPAGQAELDRIFDALAEAGDGRVAVRSSAVGEDGALASHAGVFETRFVSRAQDLEAAIDAVLASAHADAVRAYRVHAHAEEAPAMAVILQACISPQCAGVLFSADPADADPDWVYIEAVSGPGAGLADGARTPSRFHGAWDDAGRVRADPGPDGPERLPPGVVNAMLALLPRLESDYGAPLDIEWAVDHTGQCWFLQARPITALAAHPRLAPGECLTSWFFDQRFAKPIHPISQTTLLPLIAEVALGDALRMRHVEVPDPLLAFHAGQAYVDHAVWRAMLRGAPRSFLSQDLRQLFPARCACEGHRATLGDMLAYAASALRTVWRERGDVFRNFQAWRRFESELDAVLGAWQAPDPADAGAWERAWERLDGLTRRFLQIHRWSILWADYAYRAHRVGLGLLPRVARARVEVGLRARVRLVTAEANAALAATLRAPEDVARRAGFLARYGHRAASLDLADPTWAELAEADRLQDAAPPDTITADGAGEGATRAPRAQASHRFAPLCRLLELREAQRFAWERILARQRALLRAADAWLVSLEVLNCPGDSAFLEGAELRAALRGGPAPNAREIVRRRHVQRVFSRVRRPLFLGSARAASAGTSDAGLLRGLGASPGEARGRVVVIPPHAPPRPLGPGQIAVLVALDPAWTALMARVGGVVIERGGLLSHAAILAREYRVPLVIGIEHATTTLRNGEWIEIDGDAGTVRRVAGDD